jgi:DNA invertase Pin-like site-specific DNA recombinase
VKAIGYIRVSTEEQRLSPDAQQEDIESWCERYDVELIDTFRDIGKSGALEPEHREGLLDALDAVRSYEADLLVVAHRDRLARDRAVVGSLMLILRRQGARIASTDGGIEESPGRRMLDAVQDAMSEMERDLTVARIRDAMAQKKERGELVGAVPYGFKLGADGSRLLRCNKEQRAIQLARRMKIRGASLRQIAKKLTRSGYKPRGKAWHPNTIKRILDG